MLDSLIDPIRGAELLNISVDIGYGQKASLHIHEHDDLPLTIRNFFINNNITDHSEFALFQKVKELLHEAKEEYDLLSESVAKMPNFKSSQCRNPGERIYKHAMQAKEFKLAQQQMMRIQTARSLQSSVVGTPTINKNSLKILSNKNSRVEIVKEKSARASVEPQMDFTPRINKKSLRIVKKRENRVEDLYKDAEERKVKREKEVKVLQKSPKKQSNVKVSVEKVVDRLIESQKERDRNVEELRKRASVEADLETGQKFFKPVVGRGPETAREVNVWEHLYKHKKRSSDGAIEYPYSPTKLDGGVQTEKILKKKKSERFLEIFNMLNPDKSGRIHALGINPKTINERLLKVLEPLLYEISEAKIFISSKEFCESMENLLKILTPVEKNLVLCGKEDKKVGNEEKSGKKKLIHKKSSSMSGFGGIFLRDSERQKKVDARMELEKDKVSMEEIMGCTFKPKIIKYTPCKKSNF